MRHLFHLFASFLALVIFVGCTDNASTDTRGEAGNVDGGDQSKYTVLETRTDDFDFGRAKSLPEEEIANHPDLKCMVGLFAYNPPYMLEALKGAGKVGKIKLVGFDEADETLQAITDGQCEGTVVQNPYKYGYESVRILAALAKGDKSVLPESGFVDIPARKITKDNVEEFWAELKELTKEEEGQERDDSKPTVAFVTNGIASFWVIAERGALDAGKEFGVNVEVRMPAADGAVANQKRMLEELLTMGVDGIAVSPIDPDNQTDILNACAEKTNLITHDSDAPKSKRICYVGMDNYIAGRMCGEIVKDAIPDGGKIAIFVGRLEQLNANLRNQGVIDEVLGQPRKIGITGQPVDEEGGSEDDVAQGEVDDRQNGADANSEDEGKD